MKKIVTILGARPQFIKASIVSDAIKKTNELREVIVHTGQHFDANMSDIFFREMGMVKPHHFLDIHGGGHGAMTGRMLVEVERVLLEEEPDLVLVYGDTNSTLAGALAAVKLHMSVAHVEAGLRSFNMAMPEEVNRILTDRISNWLFTPTDDAVKNLQREGFDSELICPVGDVMYDVALHYGQRVSPDSGLMENLGLLPRNYILVTVHRAENTDNYTRLTAIVDGLIAVSKDMQVVWPMHPRTRNALERIGKLDILAQNVLITSPVGYLDMVQLEKFAGLIATDSGGVQKEAFFYKVPCVTLRDETEWVELVIAGWNRISPPISSKDIFNNITASIGSIGDDISPYGDGNASTKIANKLVK